MTNAYRVTQPHHVTDAMLKRMLKRNTIPILSILPELDLIATDVDALMGQDEVMLMGMSDVDKLETQIETIKQLKNGDWLIVKSASEHTFHFLRYERYRHIRIGSHLYVKHYGYFWYDYKKDIAGISPELIESFDHKAHLEKLPSGFNLLIDEAANELKLRSEKSKRKKSSNLTRTKQITKKRFLKNGPVTVVRQVNHNPTGSIGIYKSEHPMRMVSKAMTRDTSKNLQHQTKVLNSNSQRHKQNEIDRKTWAVFNDRFPGQQPVKGQMVDIRKEVLEQENKK